MKRRHHNTKGFRQIQRGNTMKQVRRIAKKLGIKYKEDNARLSDRGESAGNCMGDTRGDCAGDDCGVWVLWSGEDV